MPGCSDGGACNSLSWGCGTNPVMDGRYLRKKTFKTMNKNNSLDVCQLYSLQQVPFKTIGVHYSKFFELFCIYIILLLNVGLIQLTI